MKHTEILSQHPVTAVAVFVAAALLTVSAWQASLLVVMAVWTVAVLRVVGYRATLSPSTIALYLVLGALLQLVVVPSPSRLVVPLFSTEELFGEHPILAGLLLTAEFAILLAPVIIALFRIRINVMTSVADAFLLAFATALGAQLPGALIQTGLGSQNVESVFPFLWSGVFAYWCGIVALVWAVTLRGIRRKRFAAGPAVVVLLYVANELTGRIPSLGFWESTLPDGGSLTFSPATANLSAWIALLALAAFTWAEDDWVSQALPGSGRRYELRGFGLERQHRIVEAELMHSSGDPHVERIERQLRASILETRAEQDVPDRTRRVAVAAAPWILIVLLLVLFPKLPSSVTGPIWSLLTLAPPGPRLPTFLNMLLMGILVWRYLPAMDSAAAAEGDANGRLQSVGRQAILHLSMGSVFLVLSNVDLAGFVGLSGSTPSWGDLGLGQQELTTLLLLFATAASGLADDDVPMRATVTLRARSRNALKLAQAPVVVWLGMIVGEAAFAAVRGMGPGDYATAVLAAVITAASSFVIALLLRLSVARLGDLLTAPARGSEQTT